MQKDMLIVDAMQKKQTLMEDVRDLALRFSRETGLGISVSVDVFVDVENGVSKVDNSYINAWVP